MTWNDFIKEEANKEYFKNIFSFLENEEYFPKKEDIFTAFDLCEYDNVS